MTTEKKVKWETIPDDFAMSTFEKAVTVAPVTGKKGTYSADLKRDWCIGVVPHGGYLGSLITSTVHLHFQTQYAALKQSDLITFHVEFLARSVTGPAEIIVTDLKIGRQFSTVRVNLLQASDPSKPSIKDRMCIEALVTWGNIAAEAVANSAFTLPTNSKLNPSAIPKKETCFEFDYHAKPTMRPAQDKLIFTVPPGTDRHGSSPGDGKGLGVREQWVHWRDWAADSSSNGFTINALPYLADAMKPLPEAYEGIIGNWFPTLSFSLEVKKLPPPPANGKGEPGWDWLFVRIDVWQIKNGRFDMDLSMWDEEGELVALSKHTALIVSGERNMKKIEAKM